MGLNVMTEMDMAGNIYADPGPPPIESLEELMTREEFAERFSISRATIDQWRYGRGAVQVALPYFRFANRIYLWKGALIWWFNQQAKRPDAYHIDRLDRIKKGTGVVKPRPKRNP